MGRTAPELRQDAASPGPLPRSSPGGCREEESGPGAAPVPVADQPLKALADLPASQPGPCWLAHPRSLRRGKAPSPTAQLRAGALLPALLPPGTTMPSPATSRAHMKGRPGWPLTTRQGPARHPHAVHGPLLCLARLCCKPPVPQHETTMARCREPS